MGFLKKVRRFPVPFDYAQGTIPDESSWLSEAVVYDPQGSQR